MGWSPIAQSFIQEALMVPSMQCQDLCLYTLWHLPSVGSQSSGVTAGLQRSPGIVGAQQEVDIL